MKTNYQSINQEEAPINTKKHNKVSITQNFGFILLGFLLGIGCYYGFNSVKFQGLKSNLNFNIFSSKGKITSKTTDFSFTSSVSVTDGEYVGIRGINGGYYCADLAGSGEVRYYTVFLGDYCVWVVYESSYGYSFENLDSGDYLNDYGGSLELSSYQNEFTIETFTTDFVENSHVSLEYARLKSGSYCFLPANIRCYELSEELTYYCASSYVQTNSASCSLYDSGIRFEIYYD